MNFYPIYSESKTLNLEFVDKYPDLDWDWKTISSHPKMSFEFIQKHLYAMELELYNTASLY